MKAVLCLASLLLWVATFASSNAEEQAFGEAALLQPPLVPLPPPPAMPPRAPAPAPIPYMPPVNITACPGLCAGRCKLHSRPRHCSRVCNTCCQRCKCVPPGTYGNKEMCGKCYTDMTTHGGRPKCP